MEKEQESVTKTKALLEPINKATQTFIFPIEKIALLEVRENRLENVPLSAIAGCMLATNLKMKLYYSGFFTILRKAIQVFASTYLPHEPHEINLKEPLYCKLP